MSWKKALAADDCASSASADCFPALVGLVEINQVGLSEKSARSRNLRGCGRGSSLLGVILRIGLERLMAKGGC